MEQQVTSQFHLWWRRKVSKVKVLSFRWNSDSLFMGFSSS